MNGFYNRMGDRYLQKLTHGTLHVTYPDGTQKHYGNAQAPHVAITDRKSTRLNSSHQ